MEHIRLEIKMFNIKYDIMDSYLGEIRLFPYDLIPSGWVPCDGRILNIGQYNALYSLLGIKFGGNGSTTFGIPNMNGRTMLGFYPGSSGVGTAGGSEFVTLLTTNLPCHSHNVNVVNSYDAMLPEADYLGNPNVKTNSGQTANNAAPSYGYAPSDAAALVNMNPSSIGSSGGSVPHENRMPYLVLSYCIATTGIYPARS